MATSGGWSLGAEEEEGNWPLGSVNGELVKEGDFPLMLGWAPGACGGSGKEVE